MPKVAVFIVGGAALVTLALGIGFGVKAQSAADGQLAIDPLRRTQAAQDSSAPTPSWRTSFMERPGLLRSPPVSWP